MTDLALALGGRAAAGLAALQGLSISPSSLLGMLANYPLAAQPTPRLLGVDDFALRRGHKYATLLVDLEHHQPIEVLPDRTSETFATWLTAHPGIEVISRDRHSSYAQAARQSAPNALQVADRFHILKNLREYIEDYCTRKKLWQHQLTPLIKTTTPEVVRGDKDESGFPPLATSSRPHLHYH